MVLTDTGRGQVVDTLEPIFVNGGVGISSTAFDPTDTGLFGAGTTVDSCDVTTGWTVEGDASSTSINTTSGEYLEGSACINLIAAVSTGTAGYYKTIASTDLSSKKLLTWIFMEEISYLVDTSTAIVITLGTGGFTNSYSYIADRDSLINGWNSLLVDVDNPDSSTGTGCVTSTVDRVKVELEINANLTSNFARMDYWRYYEEDTLGVTDSILPLTVETEKVSDYYIKTTHLLDATVSNGLNISEAGDSDGVYLLSRVTFPEIEKGTNTEIQIDKFYYIEAS